MDCAVEVLAIYEDPGVTPTQTRINDRDSDRTLAEQQSAARPHAAGAAPFEYLRDTSARYGLGWQGKLWLTLRADCQTVGNAIWNRLATRNLRPGTKVEVFDGEGALPGQTGALVFARYLPAGSGRDVG